jgi:hypothetical protein
MPILDDHEIEQLWQRSQAQREDPLMMAASCWLWGFVTGALAAAILIWLVREVLPR